MKRLIACLLLVAAIVACGGDDDGGPSATATRSPSASTKRSASPTPAPTSTVAPTDSTTPAPSERPPQPEPLGFPIDPQTHVGVVQGEVGSRQLVFDGSGPAAIDYTTNDQASGDPDRANRSGWNCDTHYEYEGLSAVDFYIPEGTPILSTMDGTATLYVISYRNDFDRYGVDREPYIGNPDRSRAPYSPFPGPSGGLGVYVEVRNDGFVTAYGHLNIDQTLPLVSDSAFIDGYSRSSDYAGLFAEVPQPRFPTAVAQWQTRAGDVIGASGDAGYSEGPHLHYTVARTGETRNLCPTTESGYSDGGWLLK